MRPDKDTQNQKSPNFLTFIAYLQIIGIILVVLGHSFHEYPDSNYGMNLLIYRMMHSFRMPLFMFVSGFLMVYTSLKKKQKSWKNFTQNKLKRLILPFSVLSILTFIPRSIMSTYADDPIEFSIESLAKSLLFPENMVIPYYWFLQSSFTLLVFTFLILSFTKKLNWNNIHVYACLIVLFAFIPYLPFELTSFFSLNNTINLGLYFILGCAYCQYNQIIDNIINWNSWWTFIICSIIWSVMFFISENTPLIQICSIAGIMMCISLSKILIRYNVKILDHLIGANYIIFLLSWYFNIASQQLLHHFSSFPWWVYTILSLISGIYIPYLFYKYMLAHKNSRIRLFCCKYLGQTFK